MSHSLVAGTGYDHQREQFDDAVERAIIDSDQADQLVEYFQQKSIDLQRQAAKPKFDFAHLLYYFGGLIAIGAMTLFMTCRAYTQM